MRVGTGAGGIVLGEKRDGIASRFGGRYREFFRTPDAVGPTGTVDDDIFIGYNMYDRVEFLEVAEPQELKDADDGSIPLVFGAFVRWLDDTPFIINESGVCVVPSLSLTLTFEVDDAGRIADDSRVSVASMGVPGYFDIAKE